MKYIIDTDRMGDENIRAFLEIAKGHTKIKLFLILSRYCVEGSEKDIQAFLDEAGIKLL